MSNVHESSPSCLQRFGNLIRRSLLYILLLIIATISIAAQSLDRAAQLAELLALKNQIYASTDPAQTAILMGTSNAREYQFLQPAPEDFAAHAASLQRPDTGLIRLTPREKFGRLLFTREGGSYYSFSRLVHEYGYGSDLSLEQNRFGVGFAGADFGFLVSLDDAPFDSVSADHPGVSYLMEFTPPTNEPGAREQQRRASAGFEVNGFSYGRWLRAGLNTTYAARSVGYCGSDVAIVFRPVRKDTDDSLIILWRMLRWFPTPQLDGAMVAAVSATTYQRGTLAKGSIVSVFGPDLASTTVVATTQPLPTTLGGVQISIFDSSGRSVVVPLLAVTPGQVNFLMPENLLNGYGIMYLSRSANSQLTEIIRIGPASL